MYRYYVGGLYACVYLASTRKKINISALPPNSWALSYKISSCDRKPEPGAATMSAYYSHYAGDNYDDESIGDERSEEGEYEPPTGCPAAGFTHGPPPARSPYLPDTDDASETEFRSPSRYGGTNGTSNTNSLGTNSELKEQ